ncbi:type II toxin-antitoxin system RelE/ParE family toxin [Agrobacterium deltaense]|uniref:type II toxin-antitoxin system RelE/ParE family toxin n=1 Tax=Agrobacterium deltaense TaxID=1183412 RepID=UPI003D97CDE8
MKLTWSSFALSDRDAIFTYIEADNPAAAIMIDERIVAAAYAITETTVRILRVLHGAQEWPEQLPLG